MKVLFVRHGHSQMNEWQEDTFSHFDGTPPSREGLEFMKSVAVADDHLVRLLCTAMIIPWQQAEVPP